ncbi:plantaricin C family lantibiotic [Oceanobacillus kimchii]|uniref:plantaricin C family lantibiotic n=1 Tax=Oceanobacillus TaxID=182709 RepID=UPI0003492829|nr:MULTISPECIES: plantaricin C family lantibiotic [Oceanobacillus]MBT2599804.1 plantaricin C family lantibiotic [Oceanobacillus sp. ISL-74]MCT1576985.1 plantaricin C family lantibiotic [Oceanobacillus kimchii]MCT2135055.1 plantaricin C family lantibiotic [Oceanobacillus kimchii]
MKEKVKAWKDPLARDVHTSHPSGDIFSEISDEEMYKLSGGSAETQDITLPIDLCWLSRLGGNQGWFCTITKECQVNCNVG